MSRHVARHGQVRYRDEHGDYQYAVHGQEIEIPDADEAARLTELGAVVAPGQSISPPMDERTWEQVLQEAADKRYDRAVPT